MSTFCEVYIENIWQAYVKLYGIQYYTVYYSYILYDIKDTCNFLFASLRVYV
jgi:hypothetical protein